jgi:SAM-dependent methyltransferase
MTDENTIDYYNKNIGDYIKRTSSSDMEEQRQRFLKYLSPKAKILDAGCGPGRDLLAFKKEGYDVLGFDAAEEMVRYVRDELKIPAIQGLFQEIEFVAEFDGIWASASLVHVPLGSLSDVMKRFWRALKPGSILSLSFKEGSGMAQEGERSFTYMNKDSLPNYLDGFTVLEEWIHTPPKGTNLTPCNWLNAIVRKKL